MTEKKVAVRVVAEGGQLVRAEFTNIGREGQRALEGIESASRRTGAAMQNVGFQVQDFAVQVAGGTSASRALAQQLPQLLSGFGLWGVALGTVTALLPLFVSGVMDGADAAEGLADKVKLLEQATADYLDAVEANKIAVGELREEYGTLADEVKRALDIQEALNLSRQKKAQTLTAQEVMKSVSGGVSGIGDVATLEAALKGYDALIAKRNELTRTILDQSSSQNLPEGSDPLLEALQIDTQIQNIERVKQALADLAAQYGITVDEAGKLVSASAALANADPGAAQVEAADRLSAVLIEIFGSAAAVEEKFAGVLDSLTQIAQEGSKVAQSMQESGVLAGIFRDALDQASSVLDGVSGKYGPIIANIQAAATAAWDWASAMAAAVSAGQDAGSLDAAGNPTSLPAGSRGRRAPPRPPAELGIPDLPRIGGGGGGGGGVSDEQREYNELMREAERVIAATRTEAEKYKDEIAKLDEMLAANLLTQDQYDKALDQLKQRFSDIDNEAAKTKDSFKEFFSSIISGSDSAGEALSNLLSSFADRMASAGFDALWGLLFPSANGNVFSGGDVMAFANGGVVGGPTLFPMRHGGIGLMGEAGPEAIMPLQRGADGRLGVISSGQEGGVAVTVQVNVDARGAVEGVAQQVSEAVRKQIPEIVKQAVAGVGAAKRRGYPV